MIGGNSQRSPQGDPGRNGHEAESAPGTDWVVGEPRWKRDQRTRTRHLTQRGRATLLSATFALVVALGWIVDPFSPVSAAAAGSCPGPAGAAGHSRARRPRREIPEIVIPEVPDTCSRACR
jgi:hypothetical protein